MRLTGDPVGLVLPQDASMQQIAAMRREMGLDKALPLQYLQFLANAAHGDFGNSVRDPVSALGLVLERLPNTLELVGLSLATSGSL